MKFSDFVSKYDNYKGRGIAVTNPYADYNFARNIEILGLESHGGIQYIHIRNENNICVPMFLPDVWFPTIDPESFNFDNGDIELLDLFEIKIGVTTESIRNYLDGRTESIKIFPCLVDKQFNYIEPNKFNNFINDLLENKSKKFKKIESDKSNKYIDTDFKKYFS